MFSKTYLSRLFLVKNPGIYGFMERDWFENHINCAIRRIQNAEFCKPKWLFYEVNVQ